MNIYVGNLPYTMTDDDLRAIFEQFGEVYSAKVIIDREMNRSKGFGFATDCAADDAFAGSVALALDWL